MLFNFFTMLLSKVLWIFFQRFDLSRTQSWTSVTKTTASSPWEKAVLTISVTTEATHTSFYASRCKRGSSTGTINMFYLVIYLNRKFLPQSLTLGILQVFSCANVGYCLQRKQKRVKIVLILSFNCFSSTI